MKVGKFLKSMLLVAASVTLIAGCSQNSKTTSLNSKDNGPQTTTQNANSVFSYAGGWATNGVANPFGSNNIIQNDLSFVPLAWYKYTGNYDYWKVLATNWTMSKDGNTFTVDINPNAKWSDGSPLTSNDVNVTFELQLLTGAAEGWGLNGIKVINKDTIQFTRDPETLSNVMFERQILNNVAILPAKVYQKYIPTNFLSLIKNWSGNPTTPATKKATGELTQYATTAQKANLNPSDLIYDGPWEFKSASSSQQLYQKNPNYLYANNINIQKVVAINQTTNDVTWRALENGQVQYAGVGYSPTVYKQVTKVHQNHFINAPQSTGMALYFNQNIKPFNNVKVRQALAYAMDRTVAEKIGEPIGGFAAGPITGLIPSIAKQWLSPNQWQSINTYSYNQSKATQLLQSAGFKKTSGGWVMPDGNKFKFNIVVPNLSDWVAGVQAITNQLQNEGFDVDTSVVDPTTWTQEVPLGKYSIYANWWGGWDINPSQPYNQLYISGNNYQVTTSGKLKDTATAPDKRGEAIPQSVNVPGLGTLNPMALTVQLLGNETISQEKATINKLAQLTNYDVPLIPIWGQGAGRTYSTENWTWPDFNNNLALENALTYHTPFVVYETLGIMKPKQ
jgi:peptide/nickel transport system substrate-binding protein